MDEPDNKLTCFGQRQKLLQQFWRRWREEYLSDKQQRAKWYKIEENLQIGDVVIIRNENLPPAVWALGRVKEIFKADDGLVRTAMVKTATGELKRSINNLCILLPASSHSVDQ